MSSSDAAPPPAGADDPSHLPTPSLDPSHSNGHGHAPTSHPSDPTPSTNPTSDSTTNTTPPTEGRRARKPSMILTSSTSLSPSTSTSLDGSPALAPFPTSSSFSTFPTTTTTHSTTSHSSPPQSPNPQPLSPSPPLPSPPPPPSRPASHRLVDYFLVIGRQAPSTQSLVPMRRLSRSNSQTIQPISDLSIATLKDPNDLPSDWTKLTDFERADVNLNPGFMRTPVHITESRVPKKNTAAATGGGAGGGGGVLVHPITGVDVIYVDRKETPKPGFVQLPGSLSRGSFKGSVALCIERDVKKSPIIDLKLIALNSRDNKDKAAAADREKGMTEKEREKEKATATEAAASADSCPPDYALIDKVLTSHKGKDYYLCYKVAVRRAVEYMAYEAFVLDRYPPTDHADQPLEAQGVAMLAFPRGMILSAEMSMPSFMTFVITQADGSEMYGAALIFYELVTDLTDIPALYPLPGSKSSNGLLSPPRPRGAGEEQQVWCPKCLCLLSHHPYYDVYKTFLNQLYRIAVSPSSLPIERYIANFFYDVPVPTLLYPIVRFTMGHEKLSIRLQLKLGLPHQHVSLMPLFKCLSLPNIIAVFQHVLAEGKLVLVSSSYTLLTPVAEAIRALLYPFKWQCLSGDHMVMTRSGWRYLVDIHREFEAAKLRIAARVEGAKLPVIHVSSFNVTTSAMEWKPVIDAPRFPAGRPGHRLFRMQGEGMDVVATEDHRMLVGRLAKQHLVAGSFGYQTVAQLRENECRKDRRSKHTAFEHHHARVVVRCGVNCQPAHPFAIKGMEEVCAGWRKQDQQQLGFLRFLGFWLGDGNLDVNRGRVVIGQRKLEPLAFLIDLLDELFPHWWHRNVSATDAAGITFNFFIRCPPLYEYLRVMAVGPAGYMPLDPKQLRKYPHFDYDVEVEKAEAASSYVQRTADSTWTEAEMLGAFSVGPVRRPCYKCHDASGDRLTCSGKHCHDVNAITRAHPKCVGRTAKDAFARKQRVGKKNMSVPWPWFCPHPQCQQDAAQWATAHPFTQRRASGPAIPPSSQSLAAEDEEEEEAEDEDEGAEGDDDEDEDDDEGEVMPSKRQTQSGRLSLAPARLGFSSSSQSPRGVSLAEPMEDKEWVCQCGEHLPRSVKKCRLCGDGLGERRQGKSDMRRQEASVSEEESGDERCFVCRDREWEEGNKMLICDGCGCGGHLLCVRLDAVPEDDWFCPSCRPTQKRRRTTSAFDDSTCMSCGMPVDRCDCFEPDGGQPVAPVSAGPVPQQVAGAQIVATGIVWNGAVWDIEADGHWYYRKRWLGPDVAATFANLSQRQAVALLEGFNRADGVGAHVQFDNQGKPTGKWVCTNWSMPLIHHLQLIGHLAGARVDLRRHAKQGDPNKSGPAGRTLTHEVDHWQLAIHFNKVWGEEDVIVTKLAKPEDVSTDINACGYYDYDPEKDPYVYCLTVKGNQNFLTQRLSLKRIRTAVTEGVANTDVHAQPVYVGNCVFIPILPTNLAYTIRAPVPFIVGLHRSFMDEIRVPAEVMQVDLDRNRVTPPAPDPDAEKQIIPLPSSLREQLEAHLNSFVDVYRPPDEHSNTELDSYTAPLESTDAELATFQELNIRLTFMRVIIRFLGEYRRFCILREEDEEDEVFDLDRLFDRKSFLASFPPGLVEFARQMTDTQGFSDFVLNRVSYTNRMEELLFFDYCAALTREDPSGKKKDPNAGVPTLPESSAKPMLSRSNTSSGLETDKKRFSRSANRTLTDLTQPIDLYRTGSLTIEKIEEFAALTPSITPFLYTPGQEKPYIAPGPDESDCPPSLNYQSFPTLDLERFPASARTLLAEQQAFAAYSVQLEKRKAAAKKAAKAAAKAEMDRPQTPGKLTTASSLSSTPIASPVKNRGNLSLDHIPSSPKSSQGSFVFSHATSVLNSTSLQKIVLALYTLLNSLTARTAKGSVAERKACYHAVSIYEMWFSLFVSECEKERARRIEAAEASRFSSTTHSIDDPLTAVRDTREDAFSPVASEVHILPRGELPITISDLLSIYTELHTMVYKGSILPDELVLQDISLFCLRAGLTKEFQELYRLLSTSVPCPGVDFFVTLAKVGVSVLPGNPCSPALLSEKWKLAKEAGGKEFDFPTSLETSCTCLKCGYQLSGEEIIAGWVLSDRLQTSCPLCETAATPQLIVSHAERPATKFDWLKASHLRSTIHAMTALEVQAKDPMGGETGEVTDLGDSGSIDLFASTTGAAAVTSHDYLRTIKQNEFLFWNVFWYFTSRGLHADEYGQLPFHFLFGEAANSPTWEQPRFGFSAKPYKPWRVFQEGSAAVVEEEEQRSSVSGAISIPPSRSVSPSPFSANQALLSETLSHSFPNDEEASATSSAPSSTQASPQINGHRGSENGGDELNLTVNSVSLGSSTMMESELADGGDEDNGAHEVMSPLSLSARSLSLNVNAELKEADAAGSAAASAATVNKSSPVSDGGAAPLLSMSSSSMTSRRDIKTWQGIVSIMRAPQASGKQKAVPRAVHEILRTRKARRGWSKEQKDNDPDTAAFSASMYRQLSLLLQDPSDPIGFAVEYRSAISSLNHLIETHKKAVEALDAKVALLYRNATSQSPSSTAAPTTTPATPPTSLKSPTHSAAALEPTPPSIARSPSQSTPLSSLMSPSSSGPSFPANVVLDSDSQASVDANRKKRNQLIATLQEAISLRSEISALDSPPLEKVVLILPTIRRLFAHDSTASQKKAAPTAVAGSGAASPDAHHTAYASLVEDVLLNEVPALEDVLSQSSQNPYYTLEGFNKFCARFLTREEKEAERWKMLQAAAAATSTSAPLSPAAAAPRVSKPTPSLAYKYATFWQTARKWKVGFEVQEKQRSISMAMKKDQQEMIQDVLYETAKALYLEYLEPAPSSPATTAATTATATAPTEAAAPPAARGEERKDKADGAAEGAAAPPKPKAPLRPVTTVAGFVIDGAAFAALKAALGDLTSTSPASNKPSTPTSSSAPAASPTAASTPTSSSLSSSKASIASTISKRRVPKTLFDDTLAIAQAWLQDTVFDGWVEEVKETEHSITPLSSIGLTGLHQHSSATPVSGAAGASKVQMQGHGSSGQGHTSKPPFSKISSTPVITKAIKPVISLGGAGKK